MIPFHPYARAYAALDWWPEILDGFVSISSGKEKYKRKSVIHLHKWFITFVAFVRSVIKVNTHMGAVIGTLSECFSTEAFEWTISTVNVHMFFVVARMIKQFPTNRAAIILLIGMHQS